MADGQEADRKVHPDKLFTWTGSKLAGFRYQLITASCHVLYAEAVLHTQGTAAPVTIKLFEADEPTTHANDVNLWNLTVPPTIGSSVFTPDQFEGLHFRNGLFAEVMSTDTAAEVQINIVYVLRDDYHHAFEPPHAQNVRVWETHQPGTALYGGFVKGEAQDDYTDEATTSTPGSGTGAPKGGGV
jgi:hypothetical protein